MSTYSDNVENELTDRILELQDDLLKNDTALETLCDGCRAAKFDYEPCEFWGASSRRGVQICEKGEDSCAHKERVWELEDTIEGLADEFWKLSKLLYDTSEGLGLDEPMGVESNEH